ncbi:hypothetical protein Lal_00033698 [Lupinus albus]|nr:hypothetical protein Lal_00033698 [Lupinus albus]
MGFWRTISGLCAMEVPAKEEKKGTNGLYGLGGLGAKTGCSQPTPPYQRNNQYQHPAQDRNAKLKGTLNKRNVEIQIGQLIEQLVENQNGTFSSNSEVNPRENCNAILKARMLMNTQSKTPNFKTSQNLEISKFRVFMDSSSRTKKQRSNASQRNQPTPSNAIPLDLA